MLRNLLVYRFGVFNVLMSALTVALGLKGWAATILAGDISFISAVIFLLFLLLWVSTATHIFKASRRLNGLKRGYTDAPQGTKRLSKIAHIQDGASWLAYLGLIGTIVGFIMALSGVDVGSLSTASGVQEMVPNLMKGMMVALYTTMVGAYFGLWTEVNYRMLRTACDCIVHDEKA